MWPGILRSSLLEEAGACSGPTHFVFSHSCPCFISELYDPFAFFKGTGPMEEMHTVNWSFLDLSNEASNEGKTEY